MVFLHEQFGSRQPELIDALLDIADHEAVEAPLRFPGDRLQQEFLYQIAVLIFVNEDFFKVLPVFLGDPARPDGIPILF